MTATSIDHEHPGNSPPESSQIVVVEASRNRLVIHLPDGGKHAARLGWAGLFLGSCMAALLYSLWFGDPPRRRLGGPEQVKLMYLTLAGLAFFVGAPLLWIKWQYERTALLVEEGLFAIQRIVFGWRRIEQVTLSSETRVALIESYRGDRYPLHIIAVAGEEGCLKFGRSLADEEKVWLVRRINLFLQGTRFHHDDSEE